MNSQKINLNWFVFFVELFIIIPVPFLEYAPSTLEIRTMFKALRIMILGIELLFLLHHRYIERQKDKIYLLFFLFVICNIVAVLVCSPNMISSEIHNAILLVDLFLVTRRKIKFSYIQTVNTIAAYGICCILFNFCTLFLKNGLYVENLHQTIVTQRICYFLGTDNQFFAFILPMLAIIYLALYNSYIVEGKRRVFFYIMLIVSFLSELITMTGTGLLVFCLYLILLFLLHRKFLSKILDIRFMLFILCLFFVIVVLIQNVSENIGIVNLVLNGLGKDLTFSGRTGIWKSALEMIAKKPVWGYGIVTGGLYVPYKATYYNAHNQFLQITLKSGIVGLVCFLGFIFSWVHKLQKYDSQSMIIKITFVSLVGTFLYMMFEYSDIYSLLIMLFIFEQYPSYENELRIKYD